VERLQGRFDIKNKAINICTDRCSMNELEFRGDLTEQFFTGSYWIPCVCHFLNNLLTRFMENISDALAPIFRLQQRFGKTDPFSPFWNPGMCASRFHYMARFGGRVQMPSSVSS
jgi:hypothetical protein